jgi:hypothetical protein
VSNALKLILVIVLAVLAFRVATAFLRQRQDRKANPDVYYGLRDQILHMKREQIKLPAPPHETDAWAVVMDWGVTRGTATVVAIADGTASIYLSSGGGSLGGGQSHESLRQAALRAVSAAAEIQPEMRPVTSYPLPGAGEVVFYLLTDVGVFSAGASEKELSGHRHRLSKLGDAMQEIITQYRVIQTKQ